MKKIIIAMFFVFLMISTIFVNALDLSTITSVSQIEDAIKNNEAQAGAEDILINVDSYSPTVVPSYAFESEQFGGYQVSALLTALQTNPVIQIPNIRAVQIYNYQSDVPGVLLYTKSPPFGKYSFDNLGYVIIRLPRIKDERKIPEQININATAKILYDVGYGFGVNEQDLSVPQLSENQFLQDKEKYGFWSGRGYIKVDSIKNNQAVLSIYDGRLQKINTITLTPGVPSSEMFLSYGNLFPNIGEQFLQMNLRDRFKIRLNSVDVPKDKVKLEIENNGKFIIKELAEGDRLVDNSNWRVKRIYSQNNQDIIELYNDKENKDAKLIGNKIFTYSCSDFDNNPAACNLLADCTYQNNKCVNKQAIQQQLTSQQQASQTKLEQDAAIKFDTATKNHFALKNQGKYDLASLRLVIDSYADIISNYQNTKYFKPALQLYTQIYNDPKSNADVVQYIDSNFPNLKNLQSSTVSSALVEQVTAYGDSKLYYEKAIASYKEVVNKYLDVKDDQNKKYYAEEAQKKIVEVYDKNLYRLDKALEEYQFLIANFDLDPVEKQSYQNRIDVLKSRSNYQSQPVSLYENGNTIDVNLVSIEKTSSQPEIALTVNNKDQTLKVGDLVSQYSNWRIDSIVSQDQIKLVKITTTQYTPETKIISINDKTDAVLDKTDPSNPKGTDVIRLKNVNTQNEARITVLPGIEYLTSTSNFKLHIPVEKRAIQFSDKQIDNQITATQKLIDGLNSVIDKVQTVYNWFSYFCWSIFGWLTIKSFFQGSRNLARSLVIKEYENICNNEIKAKKECTSQSTQNCLTQCILDKSEQISKDIDAAQKIVDQVKGDNYKSLLNTKEFADLKDCSSLGLNEDSCREVIKARLLAKGEWVQKGLQDNFEQAVYSTEQNIKMNSVIANKVEDLRKRLVDERGSPKKGGFDSEIQGIAQQLKINLNKLDQNSIEQILAFKKLNETTYIIKDYNKPDYYNSIGLNGNSPVIQKLISDRNQQIQGQTQVQITRVERIHVNKDEKGWFYTSDGISKGYLYSKQDDKLPYNEASIDNYIDTNNNLYVLNGDKYQPIQITAKTLAISPIKKINLEDTGNCVDNWIKRITVDAYDYVEVTKRASSGDCTPIEFGVYRRTKANAPLGDGSLIRSQVTKQQCQEAKDKDTTIIEACKVINQIDLINNNLKTKIDKSPGNQAGLGYAIENQVTKSLGQCYDMMDPSDCKLLFFSCDPVMCPISRFNAGGKWPVNNVVASGLFGSIFLGTDLWKTPEIGICVPGVLASLKNFRSLVQGYQQCLQTKKDKGENVGICDTIRSIGYCKLFWKEGIALLKLDGGLLGLLSRTVFDTDSGGGEYAFFAQNIKNTENFLSYFTNQYATTFFNAYRGGSTEEIGDKICEAAIYGKIVGPGSFLDQLTRPEGPPQFIATLDEAQHSQVAGQSLSDYSIYYHIYAGESYDRIAYTIWLESSTLNLGKLYVTQEGSLQQTGYLNRGDFADLTVRRTAQTGYDRICVDINRVTKCGFGKVSTEFTIDFIQEQLAKSQISQVNIKSEAECIPDKTIIGQASAGNALNAISYTGIIPSGISSTGVIRKCGIIPPGQGTSEEKNWQSVGTCGKDEQGRDKGQCWLDLRSINLLKNAEDKAQINTQFQEDDKTKAALDSLDNEKSNLITTLKTYSTQLGDKTIDLTADKKSEFKTQAESLVKKYLDAESQTINPIYSARALFSVGEIYQNLANTLKAIETKEQASKVTVQTAQQATISTTPTYLCVIEYEENNAPLTTSRTKQANFYYRFNNNHWELNEPSNAPFISWTQITKETRDNYFFKNYDPVYKEIYDNLKDKNLADGLGYLAFVANKYDTAIVCTDKCTHGHRLIIHTPDQRRIQLNHGEASFDKLKSICEGTSQTQLTEVKKGNLPVKITLVLSDFGIYYNGLTSTIGDWIKTDEEYIFDGVKLALPSNLQILFKSSTVAYELGLKLIEQQALSYKNNVKLKEIDLECSGFTNTMDITQLTDTKTKMSIYDWLNQNIQNNCNYKPQLQLSDAEIKLINKFNNDVTLSYGSIMEKAGSSYNVKQPLIKALIYQESKGYYDAVSACGAVGLMQLMPATASNLGLKVPNYDTSPAETVAEKNCANHDALPSCRNGKEFNCKSNEADSNFDERFNKEKNVMAGTKYISDLLKEFNNDEKLALAAYNWGPSRVKDNCPVSYDSCNFGSNTETPNYVNRILAIENQLP
jgi:hypothetical protein